METDPLQLRAAYDRAKQLLLDQCVSVDGQPAHWYGELSTSALSTATAVMALLQVSKAGRTAADYKLDANLNELMQRGIQWLVEHQNSDGGWGDTLKSISNISTTMLCHAVLHATEQSGLDYQNPSGKQAAIERAREYIDRAGGVAAVRKRYGKDKTFSVPILTHCALAGLVSWKEVSSLPFELACLPAKFYAAVKLPVVSYALPALIAIGQVKHHFAPSWSLPLRWIRQAAIRKSLDVLERIQPPNGGFLEAAPLTSFVTMSLAAKGLVDHPVVHRAVHFLCNSVRPDGSWPIDTNLATWVTTLSINALGPDLPAELRPDLQQWLLGQQYREVHPYTNAPPGAWAWTDLPGGVPDADDTPGAMLALWNLRESAPTTNSDTTFEEDFGLFGAVNWLLSLQNRDGGFPTFCRGWGTLPFDRSSPDITAHCLRALSRWLTSPESHRNALRWTGKQWIVGAPGIEGSPDPQAARANRSIEDGFAFLRRRQREDGSWLPLWFGNQHGHDDENPVYGTSRVLMAYRDCKRLDTTEAQRAAAFLASIQNADGGWGGAAGIASSVEETALAAEVLLSFKPYRLQAFGGIRWLMARVADGSVSDPSPIGFYFAKLWYFERLYPLIFTVSALRRAVNLSLYETDL